MNASIDGSDAFFFFLILWDTGPRFPTVFLFIYFPPTILQPPVHGKLELSTLSQQSGERDEDNIYFLG